MCFFFMCLCQVVVCRSSTQSLRFHAPEMAFTWHHVGEILIVHDLSTFQHKRIWEHFFSWLWIWYHGIIIALRYDLRSTIPDCWSYGMHNYLALRHPLLPTVFRSARQLHLKAPYISQTSTRYSSRPRKISHRLMWLSIKAWQLP